jgi:hypothetical protein
MPRDRGYRTGVRLDDDGARFARLVASVASVALAVAVGLAVFDLSAHPDRTQPDNQQLPAVDERTPLPVAEMAKGFGDRPALPILAGGMRWFEPRDGNLSGTPYEGVRGAPLVLPDGSVLCVCLERSWQKHGTTVGLNLERERAAGQVTNRFNVLELSTDVEEPNGDSVGIDVAIAPDLATVFVSSLLREPDGFVGNVLAVDVATGRILDQASLPLGAGTGGPAFSIIRAAPGGSTLSVAVWSTPIGKDPEDVAELRTFRIAFADGRLGPVLPGASLGSRSLEGPDCGREGFLSETVYGALCLDLVDQAVVASLLVVDANGDRSTIGLPSNLTEGPSFAIDAQADAGAGRVFVWSPERRALARVDLTSGLVVSRSYGLGQQAGGSGTTRSGPGAGDGRLRWSDLRGAFDVYDRHTLVGSADGTRLYAIGSGDSADGGRLPSTGIWVIDTETLDLVDAWAPLAYYGDIARTADGRYVAALGVRGLDEQGDTARWQESLVFHDTSSGEPAGIYGVIGGLSGWTPVLLNAAG